MRYIYISFPDCQNMITKDTIKTVESVLISHLCINKV